MENTSPQTLFDPERRGRKIERALRRQRNDADFLSRIAADTLAERLVAVNREFPLAIDFESLFDNMADALKKQTGINEVKRISGITLSGDRLEPHEELLSEIPENSIDLVTSVFGLHWHNRLPITLMEIIQRLKPDGLFLAALPGDRTLNELRSALIEAETEITENASLRVDPFGEVRQYGALLQRAGFALPVVDTETFTIRYDSINAIANDLRNWGGTNSLSSQPATLTKKVLQKAEEIYQRDHSDPDGRLRATCEIVFLHGWKSHESQQRPLKPGSAEARLSDALDVKDYKA